MTETQTIWLVLALIYAAECIRWLRPGQMLARSWRGRRWRFAGPNRLLGNHRGCFLAHSADADIRFGATSGGCVTTLLLGLLRSRQIDGAVVTRLSDADPLRAEPFIARTEGEILSAIGSKYLPVPVNTKPERSDAQRVWWRARLRYLVTVRTLRRVATAISLRSYP